MARSQTFHDTNGVDQEWEVSFTGGYLSREHVSAYFYQTGNLEDPRQPVSFTWVTDNLIRITPALADGGKLLIQRATPIDQSIVRFTDIAKLTKQDMQTAVDQAVLAVAELVDQYEDPDLLNALADARTAAETATLAGGAAEASADQAAASKDAAQTAQTAAQSALNLTVQARDLTYGARDAAIAAKDAAEAAATNNAKTNTVNTFSQVQTFSAKPVIPQAGDTSSAPVRQDELQPFFHSSPHGTPTNRRLLLSTSAGTALNAVIASLPTSPQAWGDRLEFDYILTKSGSDSGTFCLCLGGGNPLFVYQENTLVFAQNGGITTESVVSATAGEVRLKLGTNTSDIQTGSVSVRYLGPSSAADALAGGPTRVLVTIEVVDQLGKRRSTRVSILNPSGNLFTYTVKNDATPTAIILSLTRRAA